MGSEPDRRIKVLIVDDSAIVRKLLTEALTGHADIEVVGTAPDPYIARDKILSLHPDVVTLDIEMPRMDGLTFLKKLARYHPIPVIVISSLAQASSQSALEAMRSGAVHVLAKPGGPYSVGELRLDLAHHVRAAAEAGARRRLTPLPAPVPCDDHAAPAMPAKPCPIFKGASADSLIAIGASTGGTEALQHVLVQLPENIPAIVIAQHIPAGFSLAFANRLNQLCKFEVKEAVDGDLAQPGRALIAPGDFHMLIRKNGAGYRAVIKTGPRVCYQRPSVDVLFDSVADAAGGKAIGVILTGMGNDGAHGLLQMKQKGARTLAQDEASCVVFGMPREAIQLGAVDHILPLKDMARGILAQFN